MKFRIAYPKVENYDIVVTVTGGLFDDFMSPKGKKIKLLCIDEGVGDWRSAFEDLPEDHPAQAAVYALVQALIYGENKIRMPEIDFRYFEEEIKLLADGEDPGEGMLVAEVEVDEQDKDDDEGEPETYVRFLD